MHELLVGPLAPDNLDDPAKLRDAVQTVTLLALRAVGVMDARARGLVVQAVLPAKMLVGRRRQRRPFGDLCAKRSETSLFQSIEIERLMRLVLPSLSYCARNAQRSLASCSFLIPANTILVPGILALGSLM